MKKFTKLAMAAAVIGATSFGAAATPVTNFYFSQSAGIVDPITDGNPATFFNSGSGLTLDPAGPSLPTPLYPTGTESALSWSGTGANSYNSTNAPSSLAISSFTSNDNQEVSGNGDGLWNQGEVWRITDLTHTNNALTVAQGGNIALLNPLWVADVVANLRIFSNSVGGTVVHQELNSTNQISFAETYNGGSTCADPTPHGTHCDDFYTDLTPATLASTFFFYNGTQYMLNFGLEAGPGAIFGLNSDGQLRVYTAESYPGISDVYVTMAWQAIPEPGSLALAGLGLTALAALRRRKNLAS